MLQEALIRIYTKIGSYEEKAQFQTWVQRIVTNICIDKFRRKKPTVSIDEHDMVFHEKHNVEDEVLRLCCAGYSDSDRQAARASSYGSRASLFARFLLQ